MIWLATVSLSGGLNPNDVARLQARLDGDDLEGATALHDSLAQALDLPAYLELADPAMGSIPAAVSSSLDAWLRRRPSLESESDEWAARYWIAKGRAAYFAAESTKAFEAMTRACNLARDPAQEVDYGTCAYELGYLHHEAGRLDDAAHWWQESVTAMTPHADEFPDFLAWCRINLADVERRRGDYQHAEDLLRSARGGLGSPPVEPRTAAIAANNLAALYRDQDRLDEAERLFRDALSLTESARDAGIGDDVRLVNARLNLGNLFLSQSRLDEAQLELSRALQLATQRLEADDPYTFYVRDAWARALTQSGDVAGAQRSWDAALSGIENDDTHAADLLRADLYYARALHALDVGDFNRGRDDAAAALELWKHRLGEQHPSVGRAQWLRAEIAHAMGSPTDPTLGLAFETLSPATSPDEYASALALRARVRFGTDPDAALADMSAALAQVQTMRARRGGTAESRYRFLRRFAPQVETLIAWHVERNEPLQALQAAESLRARLLQDELDAHQVDVRGAVDPTIAEKLTQDERAARARLAELRRASDGGETVTTSQWSQAVADLDAVQQEWRLHSPAWTQLLQPEERSVVEQRDELLAPGQAWLYYFFGESARYAFLVPAAPSSVQVAQLTDTGGLSTDSAEALVVSLLDDATRGVIGMRPADAPEDEQVLLNDLHRLFQEIVPSTFREALSGLDEVVVIPDGPLHAVPFDALVLSLDDNVPRYWLDDYPVLRYAHGIGAMEALRRRPSSSHSSVVSLSRPAYADEVTFAGQRIPLVDLPGTTEETAAIEAAFGATVQALSGSDATEAKLRAAAHDARYLHLATHGLVDTQGDHRLAALVLAPSQTDNVALDDDGFLQLFELMQWNLSCELAVLSACETRGGPTAVGEGVYALSRGFHVAGARQVLATLWPVADQSTALLVGSLFRSLAAEAESSDVARLVRDAKRELRQHDRWSHPAFWAPFVLSGLATNVQPER